MVDYGCNYYSCNLGLDLHQKLLNHFLLGSDCLCRDLLFNPKFGIEWYAKRKLNEVPVQEIKGLRMGVQPHGISMQQRVGANMGTMTVGWKDIHEWYDTPEFILVNFKVKGQDGAYILPKRMDSNKFPFSTIRKHLNEEVGAAKKI